MCFKSFSNNSFSKSHFSSKMLDGNGYSSQGVLSNIDFSAFFCIGNILVAFLGQKNNICIDSLDLLVALSTINHDTLPNYLIWMKIRIDGLVLHRQIGRKAVVIGCQVLIFWCSTRFCSIIPCLAQIKNEYLVGVRN